MTIDEIKVLSRADNSNEEDSVAGLELRFEFRGGRYRFAEHDRSGFVLTQEGPKGHGIWTTADYQTVAWHDEKPTWCEEMGFEFHTVPHKFNPSIVCESYRRPTPPDARELLENKSMLHSLLIGVRRLTDEDDDRTTYHKDPEMIGW